MSVFDSLSVMLGSWLFAASTAVARWSAGARTSTFSTSDAVEVRYLRIRRPGRPIVVLVHGFSDRPESFLLLARRLAGFDVLLPALPGFHDGRKAAVTYDVASYARWVTELLDHLGVQRAHLVGNSLGGATALVVAHQQPKRVASLVLLDSGGCDAPGVPSVHDEVRAGHNLFEVRSPAHLRPFLARIFFRPPPTPWPLRSFLAADLQRKADTYRAIMADLLAEGLRFADRGAIVPLGQLSAPTLLVWGEHDSLFPLGIAHHLADQVPGARLEVLRDTGHVPHLERPFRTADLCRSFWEALEARQRSADPGTP